MSELGYVHPRRQAEAVATEPPPNPKHAHLSRGELELGLEYWEQKSLSTMQENARLRIDNAKLKDAEKMVTNRGFWGRLKFALTKK